MDAEILLAQARRAAGMSQDELGRSHTSRPTLSAYEHGHKSPTLEDCSPTTRRGWGSSSRFGTAGAVRRAGHSARTRRVGAE